MIADTAIQQPMDTNGQTLVTATERQNLIQQLNATWSLQLATKVENLAYEKSHGVKQVYHKMVQAYNQQLHNTNQRRLNQQQQSAANPTPPATTIAPLNNNNNNNPNGQYLNQQMNFSQTANPSVPSHQLNPMMNSQPRFPLVQQTRLPNPLTGMISNQPSLLNQNLRLREPQPFNQLVNYSSSTNDLSSAPLVNNSNLNDYLAAASIPPNRFLANPRQRTPSLNANFSQQQMPTATNSNDILHQFVANPPPPTINNAIPTAATTNPSSSGDRLLQQILLSDNSGMSNKMTLQHRPLPTTAATTAPAPMMPSQLRPLTSSTSLMSLRPSLAIQQQVSPSPPVVLMPTSTNSMQPSPNMPIQSSPLNNSNPTSIPMNTDSTIRSGPSTGSGQTSSPDEETINLIKYLKENLIRIQNLCQRFTTEGYLDKARNAQNIQQQMVQFITNPTYENLSSAKHIRDILERVFNRPQPTNPASMSTPNTTTINPQVNELNQFEKVLQDFVSRDAKRSLVLTKVFIEPLSDVINGVPHKKFRLDDDHQLKDKPIPLSNHSSSLLIILKNELNSLITNRFSIEYLPVSHTAAPIQFDDEYLSKNGLVLRCKLLEQTNPIIPILRIRISTRYPEQQPEILSLTKIMPPKLENADGHPFFEQLSTVFVSQLFKLPPQHTITDILHIWHQSVQMAL